MRLMLDVRGSVHHSINHTEITNKMQLCTRIYYSNVYQLLNMFRVTPLIIRSSKTVIAASGFTYVCGCQPLTAVYIKTSHEIVKYSN